MRLVFHITVLALVTPRQGLSLTKRLSGNSFSCLLLNDAPPKYASKFTIGSTVHSLSSGLLAIV